MTTLGHEESVGTVDSEKFDRDAYFIRGDYWRKNVEEEKNRA